MKLLTLNCHSWMEAEQEEKIRILAKTIKENNYDVITLQEVNQSIKGRLVFDNVKEDNFALVLLKKLEKLGCTEYKLIWDFSHIGYDIYEEGLGILTKHEILECSSFFISKNVDRSYWKARKVIKASIKLEKEIIDFYSCHLGWWKDEEEDFCEQADKLVNTVKKDRLTFLMGDFNNNAFISDEGYDYLTQSGLYDTFIISEEKDNGITAEGDIDGWDKNKNDLRLDLILINELRNVKYSKVIFNGKNKPVVSDHFGVEIEL